MKNSSRQIRCATKADGRASIEAGPHQQNFFREVDRLGSPVHVPVGSFGLVVRSAADHAEVRPAVRVFAFGPLPGIAAQVEDPE